MNERQTFALIHPLTDPARDDTRRYTATRRHATGLLLLSILAVDR